MPQRLESLNKGLRTLHFYEIAVSPHDPNLVVGGTQDNGSWERADGDTWVNTNIADGGHNNFDIADPNFRQSAWQSGQLMVAYEARNQVDMNWIADTQFYFYANEPTAFITPVTNDPVTAGGLWTARQHVFRATNYGRNPKMTVEQHRKHCNVWYGDGDVDEDGDVDTNDVCDSWQPLGDPGPGGALTGTAYGAATDKVLAGPNNYTAVVERAKTDSSTLWAATSGGRVFVSKNANPATPAASVIFDRIDNDPTAGATPPRYPTAIFVDPADANHAWITFSGFNSKTPTTPGHVFEVRYAPNGSTFKLLDGTGDEAFLDIPGQLDRRLGRDDRGRHGLRRGQE